MSASSPKLPSKYRPKLRLLYPGWFLLTRILFTLSQKPLAISRLRYLTVLLSFLLILVAEAVSSDRPKSITALESEILSARLRGDYLGAISLTEALAAQPGGSLLATSLELDTRLTEMSWDMNTPNNLTLLVQLSETLIDECRSARRQANAEALFYCGRGHFAASYLSALEGNLFDAGSHGSKAIDAFEASLTANPQLVAVKLPLGMAYFYADNLPRFAKLMAPLLWFIPTGNSNKSLPYIREVIDSNGPYADAARFIYADLIMQRSPLQMQKALDLLDVLIDRYPMNPRLHLAQIAGFAYTEQWQAADSALRRMQREARQDPRFQSVGHIWAIYIAKYLGEPLSKSQQMALLAITAQDLPAWATDWHRLATGMVLDFRGQRDRALEHYEWVLARDNDYASGWLLDLARQGLNEPLFKAD